MQRWAAQVVWCAFSRCQHRREKVNWVSPEALSLARALIDDDAGLGGIELRRFLDQQMARAHALAALDGGPAALAAADQRMLKEEYFKIDLDATAHPLVASVLHWVPVELDGSDALRVGWAIARELRSKDMPRTPGSVAAVLQRLPEAVEGTVVCGTALLWADIKQLFAYGWKHEVEKQGVLARLSRHLRLWPQAWAISARQILTQTGRDSTEVIDLLAMAAAEHDSVHAALEQITLEDVTSEVRDRAQGVLAKLRGASGPAEELNRWLADQAARAFDGIPMFPHPLTSLSKTWLGAADLEDILAHSVRRAADRFRPFVQDQGAAAEELLTGVLLGELETAFRDSELLLTAGGRSGLRGVVTVEHRPITKQEEQRWGCDIALLLDAEIPSVVNLQVAELVQVKKSQVFTPRRSARPREAWRIGVPQLRQIMNRSQSSGYWLITSNGEILCVTARWLYGLGRGRDATKQRSFTVGINDVRHHAVPIEQFLPELFLGTWLGTHDESALEFARGEGGAVIPRHIFKISISADRDRPQ
jgi:hypothetical protein